MKERRSNGVVGSLREGGNDGRARKDVSIDNVGPADDLQRTSGELLLHRACEQLSVSDEREAIVGHGHTANVAKLAILENEEVFFGGNLFQALNGARTKVIDNLQELSCGGYIRRHTEATGDVLGSEARSCARREHHETDDSFGMLAAPNDGSILEICELSQSITASTLLASYYSLRCCDDASLHIYYSSAVRTVDATTLSCSLAFSGAIPYLYHSCVIAANPTNAAMQLKTRATMPLAVKPAGSGRAANDKIAHRWQNNNIAAHGILGECGVIVGVKSLGVDVVLQRVEVLTIRRRSADELEVMSMVMEWMAWKHHRISPQNSKSCRGPKGDMEKENLLPPSLLVRTTSTTSRFSKHTIDLNYSEVVILNVEVLSSECTSIDNSQQASGMGSAPVGLRAFSMGDKSDIFNHFVIPVADRDRELFLVLVRKPRIVIVYNAALVDGEIISKRRSWDDWALGLHRWSIHFTWTMSRSPLLTSRTDERGKNKERADDMIDKMLEVTWSATSRNRSSRQSYLRQLLSPERDAGGRYLRWKPDDPDAPPHPTRIAYLIRFLAADRDGVLGCLWSRTSLNCVVLYETSSS
ncbi:hypothetical protein KCU61_g369, partial [Aureobasidium melanogenum]